CTVSWRRSPQLRSAEGRRCWGSRKMSSHEEFTTLAGHASRQTILPLAPSTGYLVIKRAYDILGALLLALLVLPLLLIIAFLIRLDGGTALYHQERLGRDGKNFRFWK